MRCNFSQLWALVYLVSSLFSARALKRLRTAGGSTTVQERVNSESLPHREANFSQPLSPGLTWEVCQRKKGSLWLSQYCDWYPDIWEKQLCDRRFFKFCQLPTSKCMIPPKRHCTLSSQQMSKEWRNILKTSLLYSVSILYTKSIKKCLPNYKILRILEKRTNSPLRLSVKFDSVSKPNCCTIQILFFSNWLTASIMSPVRLRISAKDSAKLKSREARCFKHLVSYEMLTKSFNWIHLPHQASTVDLL